MRTRRNGILALAMGRWLAIAGSSGSGDIGALFDGYERAPDLRDKPGTDRENPGAGLDSPPKTGDNPGSQGGGAGGAGADGGGSCPPCDTKLSCISAGKTTPLTLKTENGKCSAGDGITLDCAGRVLLAGQPVGAWSASGGSYAFGATIEQRIAAIFTNLFMRPLH